MYAYLYMYMKVMSQAAALHEAANEADGWRLVRLPYGMPVLVF